MSTFSSSDLIFATVLNRGDVIASMRLSGVSSYTELLSAVRSRVGHVGGLSTLSVRNSSQGWSARQAVILQ